MPRSISTGLATLCAVIACLLNTTTGLGQEVDGPYLPAIDFEEPVARYRLAASLREVSGLAVAGSRLFAHNDEDGFVVELDPETGDPIKWVYLGPDRVRGDFEGIAFLGGRSLALVTAGGTVATFEDGNDGEHVPFEATTTDLGDRCEVEGLTETRSGRLLIACKINYARSLRDGLQIFAFDLETRTLHPTPAVRYEARALESIGIDRIRPSGIVEIPSGHLLILDSRDRIILELDGSYRPVAWAELDKGRHRQPEGIAVTPDGALWIADEGGRGRARLTRYGPKGSAPAGDP